MTSEQQVRAKYKDCEVVEIENCYFIKVMVCNVPYIIGMGTSRYRAFTDAMQNLGLKVIFHKGNNQKDRLKKKIV